MHITAHGCGVWGVLPLQHAMYVVFSLDCVDICTIHYTLYTIHCVYIDLFFVCIRRGGLSMASFSFSYGVANSNWYRTKSGHLRWACTLAHLKHYWSVGILFLSVLLGVEEVNGCRHVRTMNTLPMLHDQHSIWKTYTSIHPIWHVWACLTHHVCVLCLEQMPACEKQ